MENTGFIGLSNQMAMQRQMDVIANNVANASTGAFKGETLMFVEHLTKAGNGPKLSFVQDLGVVRDFREGKFSKTSNQMDLAIRGKGWFTVETQFGPQYTRNGRFQIDGDGQLVTSQGNPVLDASDQPIIFAPNDSAITITADGWIKAESGPIGRLAIVEFDNEQNLRKTANSLYRADAAPRPAIDAEVVQGVIEESNVQPIVEITRMISLLRSYQSAQKLIESEDERQRKAIRILTREA